MGRTQRILIVSATAGQGHARAADALRAAFTRLQPNWKVEHIDVLSLAPRWVKLAYGGGFELLANRAPRVWGGLYRWSDGPQGDRARWGTFAEHTLFRRFHRLIHNGGWSYCICTHFLPAQLAAGRAAAPRFALVVTDLTLHRYWAQPRVARYFVAGHQLADGIRERIPHAHIDVTGIPIDPAFNSPIDRARARAQLGLEPGARVVVIMGGGIGIGLEANVRAVLRTALDGLQPIVICGRNAGVRERIEAEHRGSALRIYGFVTGIERFFAAADLIVTKPGGLTTAEALAIGRPLLLTCPLPGHEMGNVSVLTANPAVSYARTPADVERKVAEFFRDSAGLELLAQTAAASGRADAAFAIARAIERDLLMEAAA